MSQPSLSRRRRLKATVDSWLQFIPPCVFDRKRGGNQRFLAFGMFDGDAAAVPLESNVAEQHAQPQRLFALGGRSGADVFGERADARRLARIADADAAPLLDIHLDLALGSHLADDRRQDIFKGEKKLRLVDE